MRFADALDRKIETIERPANMPVGHYSFQVIKHPEFSEFTSRDGVPFDRITFVCQVASPGEDVDPDDLAAYGPYNKTQLRKQFLVADSAVDQVGHDRSMFNLRRFLEHCGVDDESLSLAEALSATVNAQFFGELTHRPDANDPEVVYQEIGRTALVE